MTQVSLEKSVSTAGTAYTHIQCRPPYILFLYYKESEVIMEGKIQRKNNFQVIYCQYFNYVSFLKLTKFKQQ